MTFSPFTVRRDIHPWSGHQRPYAPAGHHGQWPLLLLQWDAVNRKIPSSQAKFLRVPFTAPRIPPSMSTACQCISALPNARLKSAKSQPVKEWQCQSLIRMLSSIFSKDDVMPRPLLSITLCKMDDRGCYLASKCKLLRIVCCILWSHAKKTRSPFLGLDSLN